LRDVSTLRCVLPLVLAAVFLGSTTLASGPTPPEAEVPPPREATLADLPTPFYWPLVKSKWVYWDQERPDRQVPLEFKVDLDWLAPLGNGKGNAALYLRHFAKLDGSRLEELKEATGDLIKWEYGGKERKVFPGDHALLLEAEPWVDQATCRFYPNVWPVEGDVLHIPNLLHAIRLGRSWIARGWSRSDPQARKMDFRRAIRLGRLMRQDDVTLIHDFIAIALIRMGAESLYEQAREEGDAVTMVAAALTLSDVIAIRFWSESRMRTVSKVHDQVWAGRSADVEDAEFEWIRAVALQGKERRFRMEALPSLWLIAHVGDHKHRGRAEGTLEMLLEDPDSLVADSASWFFTAEWDPKSFFSFPAAVGHFRSLIDVCNYDAAETHARTLLQKVSNMHGEDSIEAAGVQDLLVEALWMAGKVKGPEAKALAEEAVEIKEGLLGPHHPDVAVSLSQLALVLSEIGDYAGARARFDRALRILEEAGDTREADLGNVLSRIASLFHSTGDYAGAKRLYERAIEVQGKALGPDHPDVVRSHQRLARLYASMGEHAKAMQRYVEILSILEKNLGRYHPDVADLLRDYARSALAVGNVESAGQHLERALTIFEKSLDSQHTEVARTLRELGLVLIRLREDEKAGVALTRAATVCEESLGPEHPLMAEIEGARAALLLRTGDLPGALEAALRAESIGREHLALTVRALPERQALRYAAVRTSGLDLALSILAEGAGGAPRAVARTWDAVIRARGAVLDEMAARHQTVAEAQRIARIAERFASASRRLAGLTVRGQGGDSPEEYRRLLEGARREKERAEQMLAEHSASFREEKARAQVGFDAVAGRLPSESALVAYVRYDRHRVLNDVASATEPSYLAFVLNAGQAPPVVVPLGPAAAMDEAVRTWRDGLRQPLVKESGAAEEGAIRTAGEALRQRAWDPVASHLKETGQVFVVPDGALHLITLAALPLGEKGYMVEEGPRTHYLSAERDLVPSGSKGPAGDGLLALGDPAFDETSLYAALAGEEEAAGFVGQVLALLPFRGERSVCGDFQMLRFKRLPATRRETTEISGLWGKEEAGWMGRGEALHLTGARASEAAFKAEATKRRVLHLATHGFFLGDNCRSAWESTRGMVGLTAGAEGIPPPVAGENPLLLSGLALAGANNRDAAGPDEEDGILTAEEIASLDLSGVEWAVLSACETGVGEIQAGEGVFGLRRAFQVAGVDTLIMSLWSVEDEATREWMRHLYEARFGEGMDTAESVREASLRVLKRRREAGESTHPFYWAAFVAAGDWR